MPQTSGENIILCVLFICDVEIVADELLLINLRHRRSLKVADFGVTTEDLSLSLYSDRQSWLTGRYSFIGHH
jgi:hypothetical protein